MDVIGVTALGVSGFALGVIIGMALRFLVRATIYAIGLYIISLIVLSSLGVITIHWNALNALIYKGLHFLASVAQTNVLMSTGAFGISMLIGTVYGVTKGTITNTAKFRYYRRRNF